MSGSTSAYTRPETLDEALALLGDGDGDIRPLAGGQTLMAAINIGLANPDRLVDIARLPSLGRVEGRDGHLAVGAAVTQSALLAWPGLADAVPLLAAALPLVGHEQTRNRGTVGGSVAHADPSAELPLCLVTLGGEIVLVSRERGERVVPAASFFRGVLTTARRDDELITELRFPLCRADTRHAFTEVAIRHGDYAIVALMVASGPNGTVLGVGGVGDRPVRFELDAGADPEAALERIAWSLEASDDAQASAAYRRELVRALGHRLLSEVGARFPDGEPHEPSLD